MHEGQNYVRHDDASGERLRVVIVDDNPNTVKLLTYIFEDAGWQVFGFTSPISALTNMVNMVSDLVVADFRMPEMNGPEFLLQAERIHEATPKLIMTAFDDEYYVQDMLRKAGIPSVSKTRGLTEVIPMAEKLVSVRAAVKDKVHSSDLLPRVQM